MVTKDPLASPDKLDLLDPQVHQDMQAHLVNLEKTEKMADLEDPVSVDCLVWRVQKDLLAWLDSLELKVTEALMEEMALKVTLVLLA